MKSLATKAKRLINYLIKQARERDEYYDYVRMKIKKEEESGWAEKQSAEEMLTEIKNKLNLFYFTLFKSMKFCTITVQLLAFFAL
ncbi:hypothetical protein [Paenimyroides viscosum]|uniref:hypothetical protein n=1 Tax=Paenimyroides viscosum TaxID=2488729 RepID=UPI00193A41DD|nr:hypothetical protein [Paenimyroides viscosum]